MSITHETWMRCKAEYITGKGSLAALARRHGIAKSSVEKKAHKEDWTRWRLDYEAAQLAKLFPPAPPILPPPLMAPDGAVSSAWLAKRQEIYYRENAALMDKARALLAKKLEGETNELRTDELAKLTSALGGIVDAENKLLGLNHRQPRKRRPQYATDPFMDQDPGFGAHTPIDEPRPSPTDSDEPPKSKVWSDSNYIMDSGNSG